MRTSLVFLAAYLFFSLGTGLSMAEGPNRYQAVLLNGGGNEGSLASVLILDTEEGHLWMWHQELARPPKTPYESVKVGTFLNYQGRLRPGKQMGDLLEKW